MRIAVRKVYPSRSLIKTYAGKTYLPKLAASSEIGCGRFSLLTGYLILVRNLVWINHQNGNYEKHYKNSQCSTLLSRS